SSGLSNPVADRDGRVLLVITVVLVVLAAVNAIFTAWATVLDARRPSAVARALGVPPERPWVMGWPDLASRPSKCAGLLSSSSCADYLDQVLGGDEATDLITSVDLQL